MSSLTPTPALPSGLLAAIAYFLGSVPLKIRTTIYELVILIGGLATYAILAFPHADSFGVHIPARQVAILTGILTLLAALARSNVFHQVMLEADAAPTPEPIPAIDSTVTDIGPAPIAEDPAAEAAPLPEPIVEQPAAVPAAPEAAPAPAPAAEQPATDDRYGWQPTPGEPPSAAPTPITPLPEAVDPTAAAAPVAAPVV